MKKTIGLVILIMTLVVLGCELPFEITRKDSKAPAPTPEATATNDSDELVSSEGTSRDDEKQKLEDRIAELEEKVESQAKKPAATKKPPKKKPVPVGNMRVSSPGDGWLALRSAPSSSSRLLVKIPHGSVVPVSSCTGMVRSGKLRGRWCRVKYRNVSGWSFDYYLKR